MKARSQIIGIKFDDNGNIIKPPKKIKINYEKTSDVDKMALLQPRQVEMKNGIHLICRFCSASYFTIGNLLRHIKLKHKIELIGWFIAKQLQNTIHPQHAYDWGIYELNQVL